jgi:hypothetical protein
MIRFSVVPLICGLMALWECASAQSVPHTTWKTYYLPITDSITVRFGADSMAVTTSAGAALLQSTFRLSNDVLTLNDYGGKNMCADQAGTYHVRIMDDTLILIMDYDPCDARGETLMAKRWIRVVVAPPKAAVKRGKAGAPH